MSARRDAPERPAEAGRPRLDFVSPLPPARTGIADYSRDLLPHLDPLCDLRVIELPGQTAAEEIRRRWALAPAARCGADGRLPLYQMGNNRHHREVLRLALERPGVVTLHDVVLHHLLVEETLAEGDLEGYRERLSADHGWIGAAAARARRWGELGSAVLFELPAHRTLLRRQRGVLVHSRWAAAELEEEDGELAVRVVPMGVPLPEPPSPAARSDCRRRFGIPEDRPLVGSFGFQTPIKRTEVLIAALARPELAGCHLLIAGEVSPALDFERLAREAGVADRVRVTGFLDYDDFQAAIAACDVCVNLRYPTAGETSASLLRLLALGRPVAVSDYAQFAELPDALALKVPLGEEEVAVLARGLHRVLERPELLREMGAAAREFVRRQHDPAAAARAVVAASAELGRREPPGDAPLEVAAPTTLTWHELEGTLEVDGAERPWGEGESRRLDITLANRGFCRWLPGHEEPGGVLVEVQWRSYLEGQPVERSWLRLPREIPPGDRHRFALELRRPAGAEVLIVEPHVLGVSSFTTLGGPRWIGEV